MAPEPVSSPHSVPVTLTGSREQSAIAVQGHENHANQEEKEDSIVGEPATRVETAQYSVFPKQVRRYVVFTASWAGFFSPLSSQIYFPALNTLASDLNVSNSLINLTLTSYMIFQGITPIFIGDFADNAGRRPAYMICFIFYIAANVGLALQNSYAALFVLRCLQSAGSSSTIALSSGVVSDVAPISERGSAMGFVTAGSLIAPSLGPVIGGLLSQFLGWRAIFWFLVIFSVAWVIPFLLFCPETGRKIVGNGSVPPQKWNMTLLNYYRQRKSRDGEKSTVDEGSERSSRKLSFPNPLPTLAIVFQKDTILLLMANAILFAGFYDITASVPSIFRANYGLTDLQIGLCYLPLGVGSSLASVINGKFLDINFARICSQLGRSPDEFRRSNGGDLRNFPIEKARLQIAFPLIGLVGCFVIAFGWVLEFNVHVAAPTVILFFIGLCLTASFNTVSTLLIDLYPDKAATATASNNFTRCLLGAGATAVIIPMLDAMGRGWCFTFISLVMMLTAPVLMVLIRLGPKWREERMNRVRANDIETAR